MEQTLVNWEVESYIDRTHPMCPWPAFRLTWMEKPPEEMESVRQLMDAAPDLLAACDALLAAWAEWTEDLELSDTNEQARLALISEIRAAIAKAKGES